MPKREELENGTVSAKALRQEWARVVQDTENFGLRSKQGKLAGVFEKKGNLIWLYLHQSGQVSNSESLVSGPFPFLNIEDPK